jgi:hypothetical protein
MELHARVRILALSGSQAPKPTNAFCGLEQQCIHSFGVKNSFSSEVKSCCWSLEPKSGSFQCLSIVVFNAECIKGFWVMIVDAKLCCLELDVTCS